MPKKANFYNLDMIPVYLDLSAGQLQEALQQLENLEACQHKPYILDDEIIDRIIKLYSEKDDLLWVALEQCQIWRTQNPTAAQLEDIQRIEKFTRKLQKTNQKILFLAEHFKDHTINRILEKDEIELALDYFLGNLYDPLNQEEADQEDREPLGPGSFHDFQIFSNPDEKAVKALYKLKVTYPTFETDALKALYAHYVHNRSEINDFHNLIFEEGMEEIDVIAQELGNFDPLEEIAVIQNDSEMNVFYDYLTLYREENGQRFILDWLARNSTAITPSNQEVVQAYTQARFALLRIDQNLSNGALQVVDMMTQKHYLLIDKALNASKKEGCFFCCSIMELKDYIMTTGGGILIDGQSPGGKAILTLITNHFEDLKNPLPYTPQIALAVRKVYGFCLRNGALSGMTTNQNY